MDQFVSMTCPKNSVGPRLSASHERSSFDGQLSREDSVVVVRNSEYSTDEGCVSDQSTERKDLYQPSSVNGDDRNVSLSLLETENSSSQPKSSVQNLQGSLCLDGDRLGQRAKLVFPNEQESVKFYQKAETNNFAATQADTYEVDEHISQSRPNRQRRFPKKYQDFVVKKVRVITSLAKKPNSQEASERTEKSDSTAIKSS